MIIVCSCKQDSAGNHEIDCPMNPNYYRTHQPTVTYYCSGCVDKDKRITFLEGLLKEIEEHPAANDFDKMMHLTGLVETDRNNQLYVSGMMEGFRMAAAIAARWREGK
jgi:hypothetical protein